MIASTPGDGSCSDISALFVTNGSGKASQLVWTDWCITARDFVPGTASQTLYFADCDANDEKQFWTVNLFPQTISNADGNCITLGKAADGALVRPSLVLASEHVLQRNDRVLTSIINRLRPPSAASATFPSSCGTLRSWTYTRHALRILQ